MVAFRSILRLALKCSDERGTAALEFGLLAPVLVLFLVGTVEIGTAAYLAMQVQSAVEAGALYASSHGFDASGITATVQNANNIAIQATPAPSQFRACPSGNSLAIQSCTTNCKCADDSEAGTYVRVNAQITRVSLFPSLGAPTTITGEAVIRLN